MSYESWKNTKRQATGWCECGRVGVYKVQSSWECARCRELNRRYSQNVTVKKMDPIEEPRPFITDWGPLEIAWFELRSTFHIPESGDMLSPRERNSQ